jgi:glycosyltransferase involved in cell wall biosynthesis
MNKIKIAFYLNMYLKGGVEKSLITYLNALDPNKFEIDFIIANYMGDYELSKQDIPSHINIIYLIKSSILNKINKRKINNKLFIIEKLIENFFLKPIRQLIFKYRINILSNYDTVIDYGFNLLDIVNKFSYKTSMICFFHFNLEHYSNSEKIDLFQKKLVNYSKIICITEKMYNKAINQFIVISDKFYLLYNQFNFDSIYLKAQDDEHVQKLLANHEFIKSGNYIVSIARLEDQYKDFVTLIKAYAKCVHQFNIKLGLLIIGEGRIKNYLIYLTKMLNVENMVCFLGFQYNPYIFLKHAKMCILSSKSEGFGLILVESMILQIPVIATDCPIGPREILLEGKCGLLCKVSDVDDMVNAIYTLDQDQQKCKDLIDNANQYLDRFNVKKNIVIFSDLLQQIS